MKTYCKNCKHAIKQVRNQPWLCRDTGRMSPLGIDVYYQCKSVNDDYKCSRFKPNFLFKLLKRFKNEKV